MACPDVETVQALVAGALAPAEAERWLAHTDTCTTCGALINALLPSRKPVTSAQVQPQPLRAGARVGRYVIRRPIGVGGMGVVFVAHDPQLERDVAIKLLRQTSPSLLERLRREGRALAALSHPNVVAIYDVGDHADGLFIAMELVEGSSLRGWLATSRSWREIVHMAIAIGRGLQAAHTAGLVHRDIKPDNVLVGHDGRVRLGDFGLVDVMPASSMVDLASLTQTGTVLGTPAYMSPEQLDAGNVDARSDQWSLCATIFEALYRARPYTGNDLESVYAARTANSALPDAPGVPRWLRAILVRGLANDPAQRWPSVGALCDALEAGMRRRGRMIRTALIPLGVVVALFVVVGGAAGWVLAFKRPTQVVTRPVVAIAIDAAPPLLPPPPPPIELEIDAGPIIDAGTIKTKHATHDIWGSIAQVTNQFSDKEWIKNCPGIVHGGGANMMPLGMRLHCACLTKDQKLAEQLLNAVDEADRADVRAHCKQYGVVLR